MKKVLAEFDDKTQQLLMEVDKACQIQLEGLKEEARKASLEDKELEVSLEDLVWLKLIKAYGIMYNRCIDAGWIKDIHLEKI